MRERVRFVRRVNTQRTDGGYDVVEFTVAERWAAIVARSGAETEQADRQRFSQHYDVTVQARGLDVRVDDYAIWLLPTGNVTLNIRTVPPVSPRAMLTTLLAEAGAVV